jgi:hypothetical protein
LDKEFIISGMKKYWAILMMMVFLLLSVQDAKAQDPLVKVTTVVSKSAEATEAAMEDNVTAKSNERDLTQPEGPAKSKLQRVLEEQELGPLNLGNFVKHAIHAAVADGVPASTIVLLLLFPMVTSVIAASRHLIGLRGFGIFTPALVAVGFLATGLFTGLLLFAVILFTASLGRIFLKRLRLLYLPRVSLLLWFVCLSVLAVLLISPSIQMENIAGLSIFPTLVLVLLAETFIDAQNKQGMHQAAQLTLETLVLATFSYLIMTLQSVQRFVLLNPEITILSVGLFNIFMGKYIGLRLLEYWRFRSMLQ